MEWTWSGDGFSRVSRHLNANQRPIGDLVPDCVEDRWPLVGVLPARMPGQKHKIYVLESDTDDVLGMYAFKGALETGRASIDPSLLMVGKSRYLMYVTVDSGANDSGSACSNRPFHTVHASRIRVNMTTNKRLPMMKQHVTQYPRILRSRGAILIILSQTFVLVGRLFDKGFIAG